MGISLPVPGRLSAGPDYVEPSGYTAVGHLLHRYMRVPREQLLDRKQVVYFEKLLVRALCVEKSDLMLLEASCDAAPEKKRVEVFVDWCRRHQLPVVRIMRKRQAEA